MPRPSVLVAAAAAMLVATTACSSPQDAEAGTRAAPPVMLTGPVQPGEAAARPAQPKAPVTVAVAATPALPAVAQSRARQAGPVTLEQMQSRAEAGFRRADTDADGAVSTAELAAATAAGGQGARRWALADRDGDGRITLDELKAVIRLQFSRADADGNGTLTPEERPARAGATPD